MPPAALFLGRQEIEERTGQRGFPLCNSPTPKINGTGSSARLGMQCADGSLPARSPPLSACAPFRSHARGCVPRRDGKRFLSVLPETGWKLPHSRSRSQAATLMFRSSARRRREYRHIPREGTRRKAVGARSLRAGFLRAEPLGVSFVQPFSARAEKGWPSETSPQTLIYDTAPAGTPAGAAFFDRIIWSGPGSLSVPWQ